MNKANWLKYKLKKNDELVVKQNIHLHFVQITNFNLQKVDV